MTEMASAPPVHVVTVHPSGSRVARTSSSATGSSSMTTMSRRELVWSTRSATARHTAPSRPSFDTGLTR